jgi:hypothetical protein
LQEILIKELPMIEVILHMIILKTYLKIIYFLRFAHQIKANSKSITTHFNEIVKSQKSLQAAFSGDACKPMLIKFNNDNNRISYIK